MITVHFTDTQDSLVFAEADSAEVSTTGYLRLVKRGVMGPDALQGAVAPGWRYYTVTEDSPSEPTGA